jgi:hypothetical protein
MSVKSGLQSSWGAVLAFVVVVGGCGGGSEGGGKGGASGGATGGRGGSGAGATAAGGMGGDGDSLGGAGGADEGPDDENAAALAAAEVEFIELARMAARVELGDTAGAMFAFVDDARARSYPEVPAAKRVSRKGGRATPGSRPFGEATPFFPADGVGLGIGLATSQLLLLTDSEGSESSFPVTSMQQFESDGVAADVQIVDSLTRSGSTVTGGTSARVTLTGPDGSKLTESILAQGEVETCPDDQGKLRVNVSVTVTVSTETGVMRATYAAETTATVNDDAELAGMNVSADVDVIAEGSATDVANTGAEVHVERDYSGADLGASSDPRVTITRDTASDVVGRRLVAIAGSMPGFIEYFMLKNARKRWQSGRCVELVVTGAEGSNTVEPGSVTRFSATVRHRIEGKELDGLLITSTLSGEESLSPTGRSPSPVSYGYTAPVKEDATATVRLESRSRRGVTEPKEVGFVTAGIKGYMGPIRFSGKLTSETSTISWSGTFNAEFVRDVVSEGGVSYKVDPISTVTWDTATVVDAHETCSLPAPVTASTTDPLPGGAATITGVLGLSLRGTPVYSFSVEAAVPMTNFECVDDEGNRSVKPYFLVAYPQTNRGLGDTGLMPVDDRRRLVGSSTYVFEMAGLTGETSWALDATR